MGKNGFWGKPEQTQGTLHFSGWCLLTCILTIFAPSTALTLWLFPRSPTQGVGQQAYTIFNNLKQTKKEKQNKTHRVGRWEYSTRSFLSKGQSIPQICDPFQHFKSKIYIYLKGKSVGIIQRLSPKETMQVQWAIQNTSIVPHQQLNTVHKLDLPNLLLIRVKEHWRNPIEKNIVATRLIFF